MSILNMLRAENAQLREKLEKLLDQARRNQKIIQRHQGFDLTFISSRSFKELITSIFHTLTQSSDLDVTTLSLIDADYEIRRILANLQIDLNGFPNLYFLQDEAELGELHDRLYKPILGLYNEQDHGRMFPDPVSTPVSIAIVPLLRGERLIGSLNLGSVQSSRFMATMATDFVEHLGAIVAISIENVLNHERLRHMGLTDPLTGINNRRYIDIRLLEEIGRTRRQGCSLCCMYIDIDHFKQINDRFGHQGGDNVLREVGERIKAELRLSDALGRFGGEEFVVLLIDAELCDALAVAERIRASIADEPFRLSNEKSAEVTISIGVSQLVWPESKDSLDAIAQRFIAGADSALYQAKASGRNKVVGSS